MPIRAAIINNSPSSNLAKQSLNEFFINSSRFIVNGKKNNQKDQRHISFLENVKFVYFDFDQPVLMTQQKNLELKYLNFKKKIEQNCCILESFKLKKYNKNVVDNLIRLEGTVLVRNFAFEKSVTIRYTLTDWMTFTDIEGFFIDTLNTEWDRFVFVIKIDPIMLTSKDYLKISFAIRYESVDRIIWDNNEGNNHQFILNIR